MPGNIGSYESFCLVPVSEDFLHTSMTDGIPACNFERPGKNGREKVYPPHRGEMHTFILLPGAGR
jgi:hypothetical protein